jgi:phage terminase Nu1 subunit (DNA packaging protein)
MDEKNSNLVEIAKKKRYIALVEKLQRGSLSSKELKELEEFEKSGQRPAGIIDGTVDLPTLCVYFEKSPRMIRRYVQQGMPVLRDASGEIARFKVGEVFKWFYKKQGSEEDNGKDYWDKEYRKNRAKLSEIELKQKEGEVIPFEDHVSIVKNQIRGIKAGFLRLPKHIAPKLYQQDPKVICEVLDHEIRYIIEQFAGKKNADKTGKGNS